MRDSLTVLAILVIGVLTAALVGPYLVDWDSHRALIERKLSEAAGGPVRVSGPIDLKLLPRPILRLGDVALGDGAGGRPRLAAAALDAELSLTALMRGQVQVVDTTLERPRLDLVAAADGGFGYALPPDETADRVAFDHVGVRDGTLALRLADGRSLTVSGLDLDGAATSLRGPFKVTGRFGAEATSFRLATGAIDHGRLRAKLHVEGAALRPSLDLDGSLVAASDPGRAPAAGPAFDGTVAAVGQLPLDGTSAAVPWRLTGHLSGGRDAAAASDLELRAGTDMRALIADGEATASYAAAAGLPKVALRLHGAALDVDALAVAPEDRTDHPPAGFDLLRLLLRLTRDGAEGVSLPLRLDIATEFDTATIGGQSLLGTRVTLGLGPEPTAALALSVDGPEATHLSLDGRVEPGSAPLAAAPFGSAPGQTAAVFRGRAEARSNDIRRTAAWLAPAAPGVAAWLAATVPGRSVAAAGDVEASATGIAARDVSLRLDGSSFAGALSLTRAVGAERARLFADLTCDALDIDRLPDLSGAGGAARDLDLDLALAARAVTVANPSPTAAGRLAPVTAGQVALRLTRTGDALKLERLSLDVGGGRIDATAARTGPDAQADIHVSAPQLGPVADALAALLPGSGAAWLRGRAGALSPIDATLKVEAAAASADAVLAPTRFTLAGTAGGTRIDAALTPDGPAEGRTADVRPVSVTLRAEAPDAAGLLSQFGLPAVAGLGPARVSGEARGTLAGGFATEARAMLGTTAASYTGRVEAARGAGRFGLRSTDARPLLAALGLASPSVDPLPAEAGGDFGWTGSTLALQHLAARVGPAAVAGDLSLDLTPHRPGTAEPVVLKGALSIDRIPAEALVGLAWGTPPPSDPASPWSTGPFAPPPKALPRGEVALKVDSLPLRGPLEARGVAMTLRTSGSGIAFADVSGKLRGGTVGGDLALRRDGTSAALSGRLTWSDMPVALGGLSGRGGGTQDMAGTGDTPAALVASLAGSGRLTLAGAAVAKLDPAAPARMAGQVDARDAAAYRDGGMPEAAPPDVDALRRQLAAELDRAPLALGDASAALTLSGGVLRSAPIQPAGLPAGAVETGLSVDLRSSTMAIRTVLRATPDAGTVIVTDAGPLGGEASRAVDVAGLVDALQAHAIARAQERLDVMEQDIRERAAFNRQLKAIQADQQAARERAEAEKRMAATRAAADAAAARAQAAADAQAKADAARAQAAADAQAKADAARAQAAADAQARADAAAKAAAAARQKAEDARLQSDVEKAAHADAAAKAEAEKQRFIDEALKSVDPPLDLGGKDAILGRHRAPARAPLGGAPHDPFDPPPPASIIQQPGGTPGILDPSAAGRY